MKIEVSNLHFSYPGGIVALRGVTLSIEPGEQVGIIGQNGAGKTTLVRHFNGLLKPGSGVVRIGDLNTQNATVASLAARVGYVFQNPDEQLFCRSVQDEVEFGPKNLGFEPGRASRVAQEAISLTGLDGKQSTNPYDLSPTWRKMIALASVIAMDTPIVIFDEPTTGQDAVGIRRIAAVIAELRRQGKTVITITHDIDFCAENFERVIAMAQGNVLLDGTAPQVLGEEDLLATTYVDPPQLTRLAKRLGMPSVVWDADSFLTQYKTWQKS